MSNEIAKIEKMESFIELHKEEIVAVASKYLSAEKIMRVGLSTIRMNPKLQQCDPYSILNCFVEAVKMGLEPTGKRGGAYMVPFKTEAVLIPDYRGLIRLAKKSGLIRDAQAHAVYENDEFSVILGDSPRVPHVPKLVGDRGKFIGCYAIAWLPNTNVPHVEWMNKDEIDRIRSRSRAKDNGPWVTDYEAMGIKSALKRLFNRMDTEISPELEFAMFKDNEVLGYENPIDPEPIRIPEPITTPEKPKKRTPKEAEAIKKHASDKMKKFFDSKTKDEKYFIGAIRQMIWELTDQSQSEDYRKNEFGALLMEITTFEDDKTGNMVEGFSNADYLETIGKTNFARLKVIYGITKNRYLHLGAAEPPVEVGE